MTYIPLYHYTLYIGLINWLNQSNVLKNVRKLSILQIFVEGIIICFFFSSKFKQYLFYKDILTINFKITKRKFAKRHSSYRYEY